MRLSQGLLVLALGLPLALPATAADRTRRAPAPSPASDDIDIRYEKFVLDNGLTLIVHEAHDNPIVATSIWYHVGSKNERPGRTGFAHLFEHLMFNGSENHHDEWFKPFERVGTTNQNGTTNNDRTNYFQTVPKGALDLTLWLESDRMGHLVGAIDDAKVDEQRGVVQNEKRQGENQPYGKVFNYVAGATYPQGHPYSWTTIGSMEDLDAAKLDDVKDWFKTYYGPSNAVLVVAGDVEPQDVLARVEKYFGDIPSGPPVARPGEWIAKMTGEKRGTMQDRVPQARISFYWNTPPWGTADAEYLGMASDVLATGKTSRLYKRLVYDDQTCTDASAGTWTREIGSQFIVTATVKAGQDVAQVEKTMREEITRFLAEGPTASELDRVKTNTRAQVLRGLEQLGGFRGKADTLAESMTYGGSPDAWKTNYRRAMDATGDDVVKASRAWLSDGLFIMTTTPFPTYTVASSGADRSALPTAAKSPDPRFPEMQHAELGNGLKVVLVERHELPLVTAAMHVDAGYAADQAALPGTASLVGAMLDEGTAKRSALEISDEIERLGMTFNTMSNLDVTTVSMNALADKLDPSLDLFADLIMNPAFPEEDFHRQVEQRLAAIEREKADPNSIGLRVLPGLLYGEGHAYANPLTGTGTTDAVKRMTRDSLVAFHRDWYRPNDSTLVVVGDTTMADLKPKLERLFSGWQRGTVPAKKIADVRTATSPRVFLVDKPGAVQSVIMASIAGPAKSSPDDLALETLNRVLGGSFTSRINMNLREDKHWSYGSRSSATGPRGNRLITVTAPVQSDKTKESVKEVLAELQGIRGGKAITAEELGKSQDSAVLTLPGRWETSQAVAGSVGEIIRFGFPERYWDSYADKIRALTIADLSRAATKYVEPSGMTWVIVGDRAKIEKGIRELDLGPVLVVDADGRPVGAAGVGQ